MPRAAALLLGVACACVALGCGGATQEEAYLELPPETFAGLKAGMTCSATFVAGRALSDILVDELGGLPPAAAATEEPVVDRATRSVRVGYAPDQPPRLAVYRPGLGCTTLAAGATLEDARALPSAAGRAAPPDLSAVAWPQGDRLPSPPLDDVDAEALDAVMARAFDGRSYGEATKTVGVVVVHRGRLVAERYREGFGPFTPYRTWSVAKTLTGALVGILVGRGQLEVDAPAPIPEWQGDGDPRAAITLANLLHMSSGLERAGSGAYPVYFDGADAVAETTRARLEVAPGSRWHYANRDTLLLVRAMRHVIGDERAYAVLPRRALLDRIGMHHTVPEVDAHGNFVLSSQVFSTARDLARLGMLYLEDGVWNGERILPEGWVGYATTPAPARSTGLTGLMRHGVAGLLGYGAQLWLIPRIPVYLPQEAYSAIGHRGQWVTVVPSHELVVVRTGLDPEVGGVRFRQDRLYQDLIGALSPSS